MKQLQKILVPTDFSASSLEAIERARLLAERYRSQIHLLHVVPDTNLFPLAVEQIESDASIRLDETQQRLQAAQVESTASVDVGRPHEQIAMRAEALDVDLIVMGSRGTSRGDHDLGLTAEKVASNATRPVWIVKAGSRGPLRRLVCAVDFSAASRRALDNALQQARDSTRAHGSGPELVILHVIVPLPGLDAGLHLLGPETQEEYEAQQRREFATFLDSFDLDGVDWRREIRYGRPDAEIGRLVVDVDADLLLMGAVSRSGWERVFMGSTAQKVARAMPCSVFAVRAEAATDLPLQHKIADVEARYDRGREMLRQGRSPLQAIRQFESCIAKDILFAPAYEGIAEAYKLLGLAAKAEDYRDQARFAHQKNWERKVEAEIRSELWGRGAGRGMAMRG